MAGTLRRTCRVSLSAYYVHNAFTMNSTQSTLIIGLLALIAGLLIGHFSGGGWAPYRSAGLSGTMYNEMQEHMYGDEVIDEDGAMLHMMDEMMLVGRGQTGAAYEEAFLRGMIVHHIGAIRMAEELLKQTKRPELIQLANNIITSQSAEVDQMKGWLAAWFGAN